MTQTAEAEDRKLTRRVKDYLVRHASLQRKAKRARRTVRTPASERQALLRELRLQDDPASIDCYVHHQRRWLTVAHLIYGDRRERPHPIRNRKPYESLVDTFLSQVLEA